MEDGPALKRWGEIRRVVKQHGMRGGDEGGRFIVSVESDAAIRVLGQGLRQRPVETRFEVIERLGETNSYPTRSQLPPSAQTLEAMEENLIMALEDTDVYSGMSGSRGGKSYTDPRACDLAGYFLADRWAGRYTFDLSGSVRTRDRQRMECINIWRRAHNQTEVPVPE
mgnify:CR=1 FL=1